MGYILQIVDTPGVMLPQPQASVVGLYIKGFDPDYRFPIGRVITTKDPAEAMRFESAPAALAYWSQRVGGIRPDGKPNRPLTAFTVEVVPCA